MKLDEDYRRAAIEMGKQSLEKTVADNEPFLPKMLIDCGGELTVATYPHSFEALTAVADFLIAQGRPAEALATLQGEPRTDAVLLRLTIAGSRAKAAAAAADAAEMRERIALANQRPEAKKFHGREQAMFALFVEAAPARALSLARGNVEQQREPLDLLLLAEAAKASGDAAAIDEARRLKAALGLHDRRIDALL